MCASGIPVLLYRCVRRRNLHPAAAWESQPNEGDRVLSEMVERVARAISLQLSEGLGQRPYDPEGGTKWWNCALELAAEEAVKEMERPTQGMIDAGSNEDDKDACHVSDVVAANVYRAMIKAALE